MPFDFSSVKIANCMKIDFFAMVCPQCNLTHPFYVNNLGQPCFLVPFSDRAKDAFCEEHQVSIEEVVENNCFICHCGFPVRFPGADVEGDNKEKAARLMRRAKGQRVISPNLTVVSEAQAKAIINAGEKETVRLSKSSLSTRSFSKALKKD